MVEPDDPGAWKGRADVTHVMLMRREIRQSNREGHSVQ